MLSILHPQNSHAQAIGSLANLVLIVSSAQAIG